MVFPHHSTHYRDVSITRWCTYLVPSVGQLLFSLQVADKVGGLSCRQDRDWLALVAIDVTRGCVRLVWYSRGQKKWLIDPSCGKPISETTWELLKWFCTDSRLKWFNCVSYVFQSLCLTSHIFFRRHETSVVDAEFRMKRRCVRTKRHKTNKTKIVHWFLPWKC
jgi:hypothetical protein